MAAPFRSNHLPVAIANLGWRSTLIPDRAAALFLRDDNFVGDYITSFLDYTIPAQDEYTPAGLAFKFYNNKDYWWFICWFNGIVFPTEELWAGRVIRIPDKSQIDSYLNRSQSVFGFMASSSGGTTTTPTDRIVRV